MIIKTIGHYSLQYQNKDYGNDSDWDTDYRELKTLKEAKQKRAEMMDKMTGYHWRVIQVFANSRVIEDE